MRARLNFRVLTIAAAMVGVLLIPATAFAYAPTGDDFITCADGGDLTVECEAGVFDPNTEVDVLVVVNPTLLDTTVTADADGEVSFAFDVPEEHKDGTITITLSGTFDGQPKVLAESVEADDIFEDGAADDDTLADTGFDASLLAIAALAALGLGGAALFVARRSRTSA